MDINPNLTVIECLRIIRFCVRHKIVNSFDSHKYSYLKDLISRLKLME